MTELDDAIEFRLRQGEEAQRQLDMLRVTLNERIEGCAEAAKATTPHQPFTAAAYAGRRNAYEDVLYLLGPEPAWYTDPDTSEPF